MSEQKKADFGIAVPVADFPEYVDSLDRQPASYPLQLATLSQQPVAPLVPMYNPAIVGKNRYLNILPSEQHRVKLQSPAAQASTEAYADYINASHFSSSLPGAPYQYIATQAPIDSSFGDFWHMIWDQGVFLLLMLTKHEENSVTKADLYWSESVNETVQYGQVSVTCTAVDRSKEETDGLVVRKFRLGFGKQTRDIAHIHYTAWPDHGAPQEMEHMVALFNAYRKLREESDPQAKAANPIVVHCSAGVGRTGSFILVDTVLDNLSSPQRQPINVMKALLELRQHRPFSIESREQYEFVHKFLQYCIRKKMFIGKA